MDLWQNIIRNTLDQRYVTIFKEGAGSNCKDTPSRHEYPLVN